MSSGGLGPFSVSVTGVLKALELFVGLSEQAIGSPFVVMYGEIFVESDDGRLIVFGLHQLIGQAKARQWVGRLRLYHCSQRLQSGRCHTRSPPCRIVLRMNDTTSGAYR